MNWVKKCKLLVIKVIYFDNWPCIELDNLWQALHLSFNFAQNCQINSNILNIIPDRLVIFWILFLSEEFKSTIIKYSDLSTLELDKMSWKHLKVIVKDDIYLKNFVNIANTYINLEYWLPHFKMLLSIIIPKPNKASYDSPKMFQPIVLLNTLSKLIEKIIRKRLQFQAISNNFIHPN